MTASPETPTPPNTLDFKQPAGSGARPSRLDAGLLAGIAIACLALAAGIAVTGVSAHYFFQPTGMLIVFGGSIGVMLITTPPAALVHTMRCMLHLFSKQASTNRQELTDEIVWYARTVRMKGMFAIESGIDQASHSFLREALSLALDAKEHGELQSALENRIRLCERQSETAAKVLEVAGGFAPTIGVIGTVVGLIDVLRQFSSMAAIASGVGAAFTSTIYGLALANLMLLPAAHRIRSRAAETFELQELIMEGVLCLFDGMHSKLVRQRLDSFLAAPPFETRSLPPLEPATQTVRP